MIQTADVVMEVVDARVIQSTSQMFDYHQFLTNKQKYIICFSFADQADPKVLANWRSHFQKQDIFVLPFDFFQTASMTTLNALLVAHNIIKLSSEQTYHLVLVGAPKVGKRSLVRRLCDQKPLLMQKMLHWAAHKNYTYKINEQWKITDAMSIFHARFHDDYQCVYHLAILNKINFYALSNVQLANNALLLLWPKYRQMLESFYLPNLNKRANNLALRKQDTLGFFEKMAINLNLINEYDMPDLNLAFAKFLSDLNDGSMGKICLEFCEWKDD